MNALLSAQFALLFALLAGIPAHGQASEQARQWHPASEAEIEASTGRKPVIKASQLTVDTPPAASSTQRVYIDPTTGAMIARPADAQDTERRPQSAPDFQLQRSADGFLYIDLRGYEHVETIELSDDGLEHRNCSLLPHSHDQHIDAEPTTLPEPTP